MPYKKGKSARVARALKAKEPKLVEGAKQLLVLRGPKTSERGVGALKDLALLKKPDVKLLQRKNDIRPFDDVTSLEFLTEKNDSAAFLYASHNKKRPHNLVLVRPPAAAAQAAGARGLPRVLHPPRTVVVADRCPLVSLLCRAAFLMVTFTT